MGQLWLGSAEREICWPHSLPVSGTMPDETMIGEGARVRNTRHCLLSKALWLLGGAEGRGHLIQPLSFWASFLTYHTWLRVQGLREWKRTQTAELGRTEVRSWLSHFG